MPTIPSARSVYVISDLHLGGNPHMPEIPGGRGFRMCSQGERLARFILALADKPETPGVELVILGDFVDFLAEASGDGTEWTPFRRDPDSAVKAFQVIADQREPKVFDSLKQLLARGHALTLLLGNHDIELALPRVRKALLRRLNAETCPRLRFLYDGEAYRVGDALLEHGERLDTYNYVDYARLGLLRAYQTRGLETDEHPDFSAPTGSKIVAGLMNPIKRQFPFVDLLKPENQAAVPVLLALDPSQLLKLRALAGLTLEAKAKATAGSFLGLRGRSAGPTLRAPQDGPPGTGTHTSDGSVLEVDDTDPLYKTLLEVMTEPEARAYVEALQHAQAPEPSVKSSSLGPTLTAPGAGGLRGAGGWFRRAEPERTSEGVALSALYTALRAWLLGDESFSYETELDQTYLGGAKKLAEAGHSLVIFGHTHLAKCLQIPGVPSGAWYMNSGTWADLIRFPEHILHGEKAKALDALSDFLSDMRGGKLAAWVSQRPSYLRLDVSGGRVRQALLCEYERASADPDAPGNEVARVRR